ncbi:MAG: protein kinase [Elusimicrobia bacterium]|nr:protein kinase [Elusimicrobiota bacterium]
MNSLRVAILLALASLPLLCCSTRAQEPPEDDAPFMERKIRGPRVQKLLDRLDPLERGRFERLLEMARGKPRAREIVLEIGEDIILLRDLQRNKDFVAREKYEPLQADLYGKIDQCLEDPRVRKAVFAELGESLDSVGYGFEEHRPPRPEPQEGPFPPRGMPRPEGPLPIPAPPMAPESPRAEPAADSSELDMKAQDAIRRGDYAAAEAEAAQAAAKDPGDFMARVLRSAALSLLGRPQEAIQEIETVSRMTPPNGHVAAVRAFALNRAGLHKEAKDSGDEAVRLEPTSAWAWYQRAYAQAGLLNRSGALQSLEQAAAADPRSFKPRCDEARLLGERGDLLPLFLKDPAIEASPMLAMRPGGRRTPLPLIILAVLASLFTALFLLRKRIAAWVVRQGAASLGTPLPALGQTPPETAKEVTPSPVRIPTGYRIIRQIGQGGMGAVYEAEDVSLERRVAIKRMRDEIRQDPRELERFLKEARMVAKLHHPNIIEIHAIVEREGEIYLVFEFIDGMTLDQALAKHKRLSVQQVRAVLRQICAALNYAHDRGVIHRDLKPSNIMVTRESLVKVMDFGVARQAKDVLTRLSMTNTVAGTPTYMAPESETGVVRKESDLYSLAICLYEMLTGARPFEGTGAGILMSKMGMRFEAPSRLAADLPPGVDAFFASALHADPEKRPRTAAEFAASFEAAAGFTPPKLSS